MTPDFKIIANGVNITSQLGDRLLSLVVTDFAGGKADTVDITLDDRDHKIALPSPGAPILVALGYKETGLVPMGLFTAEEVTLSGPPDTLSIRGKSADMGGTIKEQKTRSWDDKTIAQIVGTIAGEHGLEPKVADALKDFLYEHLDQTDESDISFLTRIGKDHDAIVTVKGGALLFMPKGEGKTASGAVMLPLTITKTGEMSWRATLANRDNFKSVEAFWHDHDAGEKKKVTAGKGSPVKKLRQVFANEKEAQSAADAKLKEAKRGNDTFTVTMPGNPLVIAEGQVLAIGFRSGVDGLWSDTKVTHRFDSGGGFTTQIETEKPNSETG